MNSAEVIKDRLPSERDSGAQEGETVCSHTVQPGLWLNSGMAVLDSAGRIHDMNPEFCHWLGVRLSNVRQRDFVEVLSDHIADWRRPLTELLSRKIPFSQAELSFARDPHKYLLQLEATRSDTGGWFIRLSSLLPPLRDLEEEGALTGRWNSEVERDVYLRLLRSEAQLDNLTHRWPGVIFSQRPDFTFLFVSPRIEELTGFPVNRWKGQTQVFWQMVHEGDVEALHQRLKLTAKSPEGMDSTYRIRHAQTGRVIYLWEHRQAVRSRNGLLLGYEGIWLDITRQTLAEKRLSTVAWKESLGVLTVGLAHDFSNIMSGILSLSETYRTQIPEEHPFQEGLTLISKSAKQAAQLIQRLRSLHHARIGEFLYHDLNEVVSDMVDLMRKVVPRRIEINSELDAAQLPVYVDAFELRQVIVNLTLNASDAMPGGGCVVIRTSRHGDFSQSGFMQGKAPRLPCLCLSVQDSGSGISPHVIKSIFDPFFTTKPMNKGSGLGLYNARLFVDKHNGAITVESNEGEGAKFNIWLPEADFTEAETRTQDVAQRRHSLLVVGGQNESLERVVNLLRENGYYVVSAMTKGQVLELLRSPDYQFSGMVYLYAGGPDCLVETLDVIEKERMPVRKILHLHGCNEDEVDTAILHRSDCRINQDMSVVDFLEKLRTTLEEGST